MVNGLWWVVNGVQNLDAGSEITRNTSVRVILRCVAEQNCIENKCLFSKPVLDTPSCRRALELTVRVIKRP